MGKPSSIHFNKAIASLASVRMGYHCGDRTPFFRTGILPVDVITNWHLDAEGKKNLSFGYKYYELLPQGSDSIGEEVVHSVDESFKTLASLLCEEGLGSVGFVVGHTDSVNRFGANIPLRVLHINTWSFENDGSYRPKIISYPRGNPNDRGVLLDPEVTSRVDNSQVAITAYERLAWNTFLNSPRTGGDMINYLKNFYSTRIEPAR